MLYLTNFLYIALTVWLFMRFYNDVKNAITKSITFPGLFFESALSKRFCVWKCLMHISIKNSYWTIINSGLFDPFYKSEAFKSRRVIKIRNIKMSVREV